VDLAHISMSASTMLCCLALRLAQAAVPVAPTPPSTPSGNWTRFPGLRCYNDHGAIEIDPATGGGAAGIYTLEDCEVGLGGICGSGPTVYDI
jgi:hypothetical protein